MADFTGNVVNLQITRDTKTVSQAGFGTGAALTLCPYVKSGGELFQSAAEVLTAYGDGPEYRAAVSYFAQAPNVPPYIFISNMSTPDAATSATVSIVKARENHVYLVTVNDDTALPVETTLHSVTGCYVGKAGDHKVDIASALLNGPATGSTVVIGKNPDGTDLLQEIIGLKTALTALVGAGKAWAGAWDAEIGDPDITTFNITYAAILPPTGKGYWWLTYQADNSYIKAGPYAPFGVLKDGNPDPVSNEALADLLEYLGLLEGNPDWYDFAFCYRLKEYYDTAAGWVNGGAKKPHKLHVAWGTSTEFDKTSWADYEDDPVLHKDWLPGLWREKNYDRVGQMFNSRVVMAEEIPNFVNAYPVAKLWYIADATNGGDTFLDFGLMGRQLAVNPDTTGASTYDDKTIVGATADNLTADQYAALIAYDKTTGSYGAGAHVAAYINIGGQPVIQGYLTPAGDWLDVITTIDWFSARVQQDLIGVLTANEKVPYTDSGIGSIGDAIGARIKDGMNKTYRHFAPNPALNSTLGYLVTVPTSASVAKADKANRVLKNVAFQAELAGAIQTLILSGTVSV